MSDKGSRKRPLEEMDREKDSHGPDKKRRRLNKNEDGDHQQHQHHQDHQYQQTQPPLIEYPENIIKSTPTTCTPNGHHHSVIYSQNNNINNNINNTNNNNYSQPSRYHPSKSSLSYENLSNPINHAINNAPKSPLHQYPINKHVRHSNNDQHRIDRNKFDKTQTNTFYHKHSQNNNKNYQQNIRDNARSLQTLDTTNSRCSFCTCFLKIFWKCFKFIYLLFEDAIQRMLAVLLLFCVVIPIWLYRLFAVGVLEMIKIIVNLILYRDMLPFLYHFDIIFGFFFIIGLFRYICTSRQKTQSKTKSTISKPIGLQSGHVYAIHAFYVRRGDIRSDIRYMKCCADGWCQQTGDNPTDSKFEFVAHNAANNEWFIKNKHKGTKYYDQWLSFFAEKVGLYRSSSDRAIWKLIPTQNSNELFKIKCYYKGQDKGWLTYRGSSIIQRYENDCIIWTGESEACIYRFEDHNENEINESTGTCCVLM